MNTRFVANTSLIRRIARMQILVDKQFANEVFKLRKKLYSKKISPQDFWKQYKEALLKSASKNKQSLQEIFKKTDKEMQKRFKQAEKESKEKKEEKPLIDLSLPN